MAKQVVTRTYRARICNYSQVRDDLDSLGFAASKLWNVGRWTAQRVWDACGQIPGANALMSYLKTCLLPTSPTAIADEAKLGDGKLFEELATGC